MRRPARAAARISATLMVVAAASLCWAGAQARLSATVTDSSGKAIPNAVVTITCDESPSFKKVVEVESDGTFKVLILDATKNYTFHIEAPGFVLHEEAFKLAVGTMDNEFSFVLKTASEVSQQQQSALMEEPGFKQIREGDDLLKAGQADAAKLKFEEAIAVDDSLVAAWIGLLEIAYEAKDYEESLRLAERCLALDDEAVQCLAVAANAAKALGKDDAFQRYMERYQQANPDDPATVFNQAAEALNRMDDDAARPLLEECLEIDPDFPKCLFEYGMLLLRTGDMAGAKSRLQRYLEVAPEGPDAASAADTIKYL
jgi:tetratricopeptide (TPR) repeat protein